MTVTFFQSDKKMLNNILKSKNILLSHNFWIQNQNLATIQRMSDFSRGLIQLPPAKTRLGKSKLLFVVSIDANII